ncbi:MAG: hypothetical protein EHM63_05230 [Actinobacteria bacterium]|nr:MAG: hypothetical protein EHM63_05230 [Actinomycetota bacterium]
MIKTRSEPCSACPYKRSTPSGVWAAHEYDKLRGYDELTGELPFAVFACHATPDHHCHGWVAVHMNRGHENELLALRVSPTDFIPDKDDLRFYESGNEAADFGQRDVENQTPVAAAAVEKLLRKNPRLRSRDEWDQERMHDELGW